MKANLYYPHAMTQRSPGPPDSTYGCCTAVPDQWLLSNSFGIDQDSVYIWNCHSAPTGWRGRSLAPSGQSLEALLPRWKGSGCVRGLRRRGHMMFRDPSPWFAVSNYLKCARMLRALKRHPGSLKDSRRGGDMSSVLAAKALPEARESHEVLWNGALRALLGMCTWIAWIPQEGKTGLWEAELANWASRKPQGDQAPVSPLPCCLGLSVILLSMIFMSSSLFVT